MHHRIRERLRDRGRRADIHEHRHGLPNRHHISLPGGDWPPGSNPGADHDAHPDFHTYADTNSHADTTPTPTPSPTPTETSTPEPTAEPKPEPTPTPTQSEEPDLLERGDDGPAVEQVQQRLRDLGYWIGPIDGVFGTLTEQAVFAFQGWEGITRDGVVGPETRATLADAGRPAPIGDHADMLQIDEDRGVMLAVADGATQWAFHISAGSYEEYYNEAYGGTRLADTPNGTWEVYRQIDGLRESPLGLLNRPKYFHEAGIAVHGSPNVPAWGVSHGCVRVTNEAINFIWEHDLAPIGTTVVVTGPTP